MKKAKKTVVKKKKHAGGRSRLPDSDRKVRVDLFFKQGFIEEHGGLAKFKEFCHSVINPTSRLMQ
jgi:hypothetical protein